MKRPIEKDYRHIVSDNRRWEKFEARPGDIFVCTPPKCGTTWTQTIVMALLYPDGDVPGAVVDAAPWIDARFVPIDEVLARLASQTRRRCIKTHTPADGIPWFPEAFYIVVGRDGRDAFMSFHNHMSNMRPDKVMDLAVSAMGEGIELGDIPPVDDIHAFYAWWLQERIYFDHLATFWTHREEKNVFFVHFDDLKSDLAGSMRAIADFVGIEVDEARWSELVERCTFASMKARSSEIGDFEQLFVGGADTFLYKGTNNRWHGVLDSDELAAFDRLSAELLPPEAVAWLNRGSVPAS